MLLESDTKNNINERNAGSKHYSVCDDVLSYAERVVMPEAQQNRILNDFYERHPGIVQRISYMGGYAYWPNVEKRIERLIKQCRREMGRYGSKGTNTEVVKTGFSMV